MNSVLKNIAACLLLINGVGAIYGGGHLIAQPNGSTLHLSLSALRYSPFTDFLIPGILLVAVNGLFSFFVLAVLILDIEYYPRLLMAQGAVLALWIAVQVMVVGDFNFLDIIFGSIGLLLIICGSLIKHSVAI